MESTVFADGHCVQYSFDGKLHNEGGPAVENIDTGNASYFLHGIFLSYDEYNKCLKILLEDRKFRQ